MIRCASSYGASKRSLRTLRRSGAGWQRWKREDEATRRLMAIPSVGLLGATAAVATMGDPRAFGSGREFAAFLGLVPRETGTGGRVRLLGISNSV